MLSFFFFILILLGFISGCASIYVFVARFTSRIGPAGDDSAVSNLRDEMDALSLRLGRVEEELSFYKELKAPAASDFPASLPAPEKPGS